MKTKAFFVALVCCLGLSTMQANARSWRVNNNSQAKADFADLNAAMQKVSDGDIIYLDKGTVINSVQSINKSVTVIGPGNANSTVSDDKAFLSSVSILADGVKITGCSLNSITIGGLDAVVERCYISGDINGVGYDNDFASIRSNYILGRIIGNGSEGAAGWEIANNIIACFGSYTVQSAIYNLSDATIDHNFIVYRYNTYRTNYNSSSTVALTIYDSTLSNNIITIGFSYTGHIVNFLEGSDNNIINNVYGYQSGCSSVLGGSYNISIGNTYYNVGESVEDYQSYADSKAKNYASDGGNCGPWDGAFPFNNNFYPLHVPRFESLTVPSKPDSEGKLKVSLKVVNQNQ